MSILEKHKKALVGHIKTVDTNSILGSCVPCKKGNDLYIITCGHVIYKDDWSGLRHELTELKVEVDSHAYRLNSILGTLENTQKTDLSIIQIEKIENETNLSFVELKLLEAKNNTYLHNSKLCVYPFNERVQAFGDIKYAGNEIDFTYSVQVDKTKFYDINLGAAGASHYKGISGSGLFCEHNEDIYLQGIIKGLPQLSVNSEVDLINVKAIPLFWENTVVESTVEKQFKVLHHNSLLNSNLTKNILKNTLVKQAADKKYRVLVCAPSDISSSPISKDIYAQLTEKLDENNINYSVGGGREQLVVNGSYPHIEEQFFIESKECSSLIIIADDHSTFSQLSLLSNSIFNSEMNNIDVYVFYEDKIINSQSFIKDGPFKFAEERVKARVYEFSKFSESTINDVVSKILSHHLFLGRIV